MLKFAMLFVLSFGSVAAVANAAQPMEHEVFANAGALSVERLTPEQMQESEGEFFHRFARWAYKVIRDGMAYQAGEAAVGEVVKRSSEWNWTAPSRPIPTTNPYTGRSYGSGSRPTVRYWRGMPYTSSNPFRSISRRSFGGGYGAGYCGSSAGWGVCS